MIRRPPRSTHCISSAASDVYKRQALYQALAQKNEKLMKELKEQRQACNELMTKVFAYQSMLEEVKVGSESPSRTAQSPAMELSKQVIDRASEHESSPQRLSPLERRSSVNSVRTCPVRGPEKREKEEMEMNVANHIKMLATQCLEKVPLK
eukprot:TRINITY_DN20638_c0_g1_i4.p2 TRINITY_DN20638_c0_g1~~TRINITY_DN20638_c0_g1_i4.p2  ORF type:complete len:159 (-),score=71.00 TRINITY_DN20638_c0_g1_i4:250-702(-)